MNEIEKAIKHFEGLQKRYTTQHNGKHCELVKTALTALQEKQEREQGCGDCKGLVRGAFTTAHYCYQCGRKLGESNG